MNIVESWMDSVAFRDQTLGRRSQIFEATRSRASSVQSLYGTWTVKDLLANRRDDVIAWFQNLDGKHRTARVSPTAAIELYEAGTTLYLQNVPWLENLAHDVATAFRMPRS